MTPSPMQALAAYEEATNSHDFDPVEPLLSPDAVYFFSHGTYRGQAEIRQAFEQTWDRIRDETYRIQDVTWLVQSEQTAVCTYTYRWDGWIDGKHQSGSGRGTNVLIRQKDKWIIVHEHLSPLPSD